MTITVLRLLAASLVLVALVVLALRRYQDRPLGGRRLAIGGFGSLRPDPSP